MDIGFNRQGQQAFVADLTGLGDSRPDWLGLRARLAAAHAARSAIAEIERRAGSFDCVSAQALTAFGTGLDGVNLSALGYGKSNECNWDAVVDDVNVGGRG